jgi:hypothetical protein
MFLESGFSTKKLADGKNPIQEFQESLNQAMYKNVKGKDYPNIDIDIETEADVKEIDEFIENH